MQNKRAEYGGQIVVTLSRQLAEKYGRNFEEKNFRRMLQFAEQFQDDEIVDTLARQLSWSHFLALLPLKSPEARLFYARQTAAGQLGVRALRQLIARKAFGAYSHCRRSSPAGSPVPPEPSKTHIFLIFFGLERRLSGERPGSLPFCVELERFIMEFGKGFTFVERQKRMIIDGEDFYLDLLFYHRILKRLVGVELKLGKFQARDKGQMELYLKWLDRHERQDGENAPIGLILCAAGSREQVELLEMHKDGIVLAEYWTDLASPKKILQHKIHTLLLEAQERQARRRLLAGEPTSSKQITD